MFSSAPSATSVATICAPFVNFSASAQQQTNDATFSDVTTTQQRDVVILQQLYGVMDDDQTL